MRVAVIVSTARTPIGRACRGASAIGHPDGMSGARMAGHVPIGGL